MASAVAWRSRFSESTVKLKAAAVGRMALESTRRLCYIFQGLIEIIEAFGRDCFGENPPAIRIFQHGRVAQLAEHSALNRQVVGSIPTASTK